MRSHDAFLTGMGVGGRRSHSPPVSTQEFPVQSASSHLPSYPFQPLPTPNGLAPYRFDLSQLLDATDIARITAAGSMVVHTVGDTGDYRGAQQDFVAAMLVADATALPAASKPAFFYHLGDVVYFAGDIDKYGDNFYETYKNYPGFIVGIPGNHDCQPDDPADGPVDPNKKPLDGWVQNFMSKDPTQPGSNKTDSTRTQMDLPNVFWTFTTPFSTFVGLFSNVGESQGEIHQDQIDWFRGELAAAEEDLALVVAVHHPPYSGDVDHSGSDVVYQVLFDAFAATGRYPDLILSGHVHNYQRFTHLVQGPHGPLQVPCIVAGAGGYTRLSQLYPVAGSSPPKPYQVNSKLRLENYDQTRYGFLRLEFEKAQIVGTYFADEYVAGGVPTLNPMDKFTIDLVAKTVKSG